MKREVTPKKKVDRHGNTTWFYNGQFHREGGPAFISREGTKKWFIHGSLHREKRPAIEWADGGIAWFHMGKIHRTDGPALIARDGQEKWYLNNIEMDRDVWEREIAMLKISII
jgi:hypothetical protein